MPVFDFTSPDGKQYSVTGPEGSTPEQAFGMLQQHLGQPAQSPGLAKAAEYGAVSGPGGPGDLRGLAKAGASYLGIPESAQNAIGSVIGATKLGRVLTNSPTSEQTRQLYQGITGRDLPEPQTTPEKLTAAGAGALTNPTTYTGAGSLGLKALGGVASAVGGEEGGNIAGTPGRIAGALLGGLGASKALGPKAAEEVLPTIKEQSLAKDALYKLARQSGVEFNARKLADEFAAPAEQILSNGEKYGFTGGADGSAPKTFALIGRLRDLPADSRVTAANLDAIRIQASQIARETRDFKPTPDAKAAMVFQQLFRDYLENPPAGHIVAGDAPAYVSATKAANAENTALQQARTAERLINNAQVNTQGAPATRLDNQLKSQFKPILKNEKLQRGLNDEQLDAINTLVSGTPYSNTMAQLGRGHSALLLGLNAANAIPHLIASGGATAPVAAMQGAASLGAFAAKKAAERASLKHAQDIIAAAQRRSALYNRPPAVDLSPNIAQIARGGLLGLQ